MAAKFTIRQGDRRPWIAYKFGFSLVGATSCNFSLRDEATDAVFIDDQAAVIANGTYDINGVSTALTPADGVVFYPWGATDTGQARKSCMGLFKVIWPGGLQETVPSEGYIPVTIGDNF
jgi:hypothetical protein